MANPDFVDESVSDQQGAGPIAVFFPAAWSAGQIALLFVTSDGGQATLSTPNGFVLATDPLGNAASADAGAGVCSITVFWKRLIGSTATTDPPPIIAAASTWGGTCIATHINTYSNCRTNGTPFHTIASAVVSSATANITPPSVTPTINGCTVVTCCAGENDDSTFNDWTFPGAAAPTGQIDNGWHSPTGNLCSFTGGRGGYATAGGARSGTSTFGAAARQAQVTMVLASLDESGLIEDVPYGSRMPSSTSTMTWAASDSDLAPPTNTVEDAPVSTVPMADPWVVPASSHVDADIPSSIAAGSILDEGGFTATHVIRSDDVVWMACTDDDIVTGTTPAGFVDEVAALPLTSLALATRTTWVAIDEDLVTMASAAAVGAGGDAQRSFQLPPQAGTLTTAAPIASWAQSHAYVIDPTSGGIHRVQNGGTLYQCAVDGNSASSGTGPNATTPGTTQADNTVTWYVIGPVAPTDTTAGSQILVTVMRGNQSQTATVDPSDNDGGVYTAITNNAYAGFPASFAGVWRRITASNAKANFAASAVWGGSGGAGDEQSVAWVRLDGVVVGAPHTFSHVERASATGGIVTAASITTTKRCLIVSFWHGNGNVQSAGQPDAATPAGGLVLVANATGPLSLTTSGYIQHMVAWRIASPGTFAETWTASPTNQGAQINTIAYETLDQGGLVDDIVGVTWIGVHPAPSIHVAPSNTDEIPTLSDESMVVASAMSPALVSFDVAVGDDSLPMMTALDDDRASIATTIEPTASPTSSTASDDLPASLVDDYPQPSDQSTSPVWSITPNAANEDITGTAIVDEKSQTSSPIALAEPVLITLSEPDTISIITSDEPATPDWRTFVLSMIGAWTHDTEELGTPPPPLPQIVDDDAIQTIQLPGVPGLAWRAIYEEWLLASISPTPHAAIRVVVLDTATGVDMATTIFRQGSTHGPLEAVAYTATRLVDFPAEYPGGVTFRMVSGTTVVTGTATGDAAGRLTYAWGDRDLDVVGTYDAVFIGTDAQGHTETFPRGTNLSLTVIAAL